MLLEGGAVVCRALTNVALEAAARQRARLVDGRVEYSQYSDAAAQTLVAGAQAGSASADA